MEVCNIASDIFVPEGLLADRFCSLLGKDMNDLYVTTASNTVSGEDPASHPEGGDLFVLKGLGKGVERGRFSG